MKFNKQCSVLGAYPFTITIIKTHFIPEKIPNHASVKNHFKL